MQLNSIFPRVSGRIVSVKLVWIRGNPGSNAERPNSSLRRNHFANAGIYIKPGKQPPELLFANFLQILRLPGPFELSVFRGHLNFPSSSHLYSNRNPSPSQAKALIRSFRLPQKRNSMSVSKGFRLNRSRTVAASPSIPYLKSVYPQAM